MGRILVIGAVLGLVGGIMFSVLYFGTGQITTPMAYIHEASGTAVGLIAAWIIGLYRRGAKGMAKALLIGAVAGITVALVFNQLYFSRQDTVMAYVHDIAGTFLGITIAWIAGLQKRLKVAR